MARCHKALVRWRDLEIVERFEQGLRDGQTARSLLSDLARKYNLSDRWIWEIVNRPSEPAPQQSTLFTKPGRNAPAGVSAPILSQPLNPSANHASHSPPGGGMSTSSPQRLYAAPATTPPPSWPSPAASVVTLCWKPAR
nr:Mor transcription activator family protein [Pseudomonas aeruginosa]